MISGSMVALVTPMLASGEIDWPGLQQLVEWHIAEGTHAIVAVGTSGESATLNVREHSEVIAAVVQTVAGRIPVIAGTGANATDEAIELTRMAKQAGADACLLVTPYYNKPTQRGLELHFRAVAEAVEIPQILYNVPGRTACDMLPPTVLKLTEMPNIVGIKEATGDLERARQLLQQVPDDFALYSGDDETALRFILLGGKGDISVTANVAPRAMARMCELALQGQQAEAEEIDIQLAPLHQKLFLEANPIPVKWALYHMGRIGPGIRLPLTPLAEDCQANLVAALQEAGIA